MLNATIEGYRLSSQQERIWLWHSSGSAANYNAFCLLSLDGELDHRALRAAIASVVARHEILRTTFPCIPGVSVPVQAVSEETEFELEQYDLCNEESEVYKAPKIEALMYEAQHRRFDFENGPLLRVQLIAQSEIRHLMVITLPALCIDRAGLNNLVDEICRFYGMSAHEDDGCEEVLQYADVAEWQYELLDSEKAGREREYWRRYKDTSLDFRLASGAPDRESDDHDAADDFLPAVISGTIPGHVAERIEQIARQQGVSPDVFLLACWQVLLWRLSDQASISVGVAFGGRPYEELRNVIGSFVRFLPIRLEFEQELTLGEVVKRLSISLSEARKFQEWFLWEDLKGPSPNPDGPPFLAYSFEYAEAPRVDNAAGVTFTVLRQELCAERFKIKLSCMSIPTGLRADLHYDGGLFPRAQMERHSAQFRQLVENAARNPGSVIDQIEILSDSERSQLLFEWNNTSCEYPRQALLHELFEAQAKRTPESIAAQCEDQQISYDHLDRLANRVANHLRSQGVGPDSRVGIMMERSIEMVAALLGILKAGGAYVPLDPDYPRDRLLYLMQDAGVATLLTQEKLVGLLTGQEPQTVCIDRDWETITRASELKPEPRGDAQNLAYVIYTSGSTGWPKGVMIPHRAILNRLFWMLNLFGLNENDRVLQKTIISFDASVWELFVPLMCGARLVLARPGGHRDSAYLTRAIQQHEVTVLQLVPSMLQVLLKEPAVRDCRSLQSVFCGGEHLSAESKRRFEELLTAELHNLYGPTETSIDAAHWACKRGDDRRIVPIGRPISNTQVYILDRHLNLEPVGAPGHIYIGGSGLAHGYLGRAELTAERFMANPYSSESGARLYFTGDQGRYLADGAIEFLGRLDHQVKLRGFRVELGEIEAALLKYPGVRQCAVSVSEDQDGDRRLVAYVVASEQTTTVVPPLRAFIEDKLPGYMIPSVFVELAALPLAPNGKLDRKALPAPPMEGGRLGVASRRLSTPIEEMMAGIWRDVLRLDNVDVEANFFELGGHSLLATRLVSRVRETFKVDMPLGKLFEEPTIAGLAKMVEEENRIGTGIHPTAIEPVGRDASLPLSFAQQRVWFLNRLEPGNVAYNLPTALRLTGVLNLPGLEQALREIIRRHEVLRTYFSTIEQGPIQIISEVIGAILNVRDLRGLSEEAREAEAQRQAREEANQVFDLSLSPLLAVKLLRLTDHEHVVLLTMHHIISDGWSMGVLTKEVTTLYNAYCQGEPSPFDDPPIQYADYAAWQRQWLRGETLETQLSYWREQLAEAPASLELPTDHPRPAVQSHKGASLPIVLDGDLTAKLNRISQREGVTLFMSLLAGFAAVLSRYTRHQDIVVGTAIANRTRSETETLIGFFVNTLALRIRLEDEPSWRELLRRVREVTLGAYAHQDLPFEKLVEELRPERDLSQSPVFQAMLVVQNAPQDGLELQGLRLGGVSEQTTAAKFDLTLVLTERRDGIYGGIVYNKDLFEEETIRRIAGHYEKVLEALAAKPGERVTRAEMLSETERHQLLAEWNRAERNYSGDDCLHELFEAQVERTPDKVAVAFGDSQLTYRELNLRANQLAHHLRSLGAVPESPVGLMMERSTEMIIAMLGIMKAGAAYVPLDPSYPTERLSSMLEDSGILILVSEDGMTRNLPATPSRVVSLTAESGVIAKAGEQNLLSGACSDNLAYVIYTSGSTGRPKGVLIHHRGVCNLALAQVDGFEIDADSRLLQFASLSFDASVSEVFTALITGATLCLAARDDLLPGPNLVRLLTREAISIATMPPSVLATLPSGELPAFRTVISAGEACTAEVVGLWSPGRRFINAYGPTEVTVCATMGACSEATGKPSIGRPLDNMEVYLLDDQQLPVPIGVFGDLYTGGVGVARGYMNRPELTAEKFVPHPYAEQPGQRLYRTGDVARHSNDGKLDFIGRTDDQVKMRGFRIELGEVEAALSDLDEVKTAVAVLQGEAGGEKRLVGYVLTEENATQSEQELRDALKERLPEYMIPAFVVRLAELPLTPNGKIDRRALAARDSTSIRRTENFVAPRTMLELKLTQIWENLLDVRPIGIRENFFDLGGHSLLSVRLLAHIEQEFGHALVLTTLFQNGTIEQLAKVLGAKETKADWSPLVPMQPRGLKRPFFCVHPIGGQVVNYYLLSRHLGLDRPFYGLQARPLHDSESKDVVTIEATAEQYIRAIKTADPEGPYLLGGYSFGGLVAFEMAHQLKTAGGQVASVVMFDTHSSVFDRKLPEDDSADLLVRLAWMTSRKRGLRLLLPVEELRKLAEDDQLEYFMREMDKHDLLPEQAEVIYLRRFLRGFRARQKAARMYEPGVYDGRVTLLRCEQEDELTTKRLEEAGMKHDDQTLGWGDLVSGAVDIRVVPGFHEGMMIEPYVQGVAAQLCASIEDAETFIR